MQSSFSIKLTSGHFLFPILFRKCLFLILKPWPHITEHSDHSPHSDTAQISSKPLILLNLSEMTNCMKIAVYGHSGISAAHISLATSCLLQPIMSAFCGIRYFLPLILNPFPHETEHGVQSSQSVTRHSAKKIKKIQIRIKLISSSN